VIADLLMIAEGMARVVAYLGAAALLTGLYVAVRDMR
jgi:hypothetical protein